MSAMQNNFYRIRLHTTFTGDGYLKSCIAMVIKKENRHCQNHNSMPVEFMIKRGHVCSAAALSFIITLNRTSSGAHEFQRPALNGTIASEQCLRRRNIYVPKGVCFSTLFD